MWTSRGLVRRFCTAVLLLVISLGSAGAACQDYLAQAFDRLNAQPFTAETRSATANTITYLIYDQERPDVFRAHLRFEGHGRGTIDLVNIGGKRWSDRGEGWKLLDERDYERSISYVSFLWRPFSAKDVRQASCMGSTPKKGVWHSVFGIAQGRAFLTVYVNNLTGLPESWSTQNGQAEAAFRYDRAVRVAHPMP